MLCDVWIRNLFIQSKVCSECLSFSLTANILTCLGVSAANNIKIGSAPLSSSVSVSHDRVTVNKDPVNEAAISHMEVCFCQEKKEIGSILEIPKNLKYSV